MNSPEITKYCNLMEKIKVRMGVFDFFVTGEGHALYKPTTAESACLQLRKILELIAMASLIANKDAYSKVHRNFKKHWRVSLLFKDLEKLNPGFYPRPVILVPPENPQADIQFNDRVGDFMTKEEFIKAYKLCSAILHSENPYAKDIDYNIYEEKLAGWGQKIVNLLDLHRISLLDNKESYLVQMNNATDGRVHLLKAIPRTTRYLNNK